MEPSAFARGCLKNTRFLNFNLCWFGHVLEELGRAKTIIAEVIGVVERWPQFAEEAKLPGNRVKSIQKMFRMRLPEK
jgi:hypothetical protein